jgi:hypothetical protein
VILHASTARRQSVCSDRMRRPHAETTYIDRERGGRRRLVTRTARRDAMPRPLSTIPGRRLDTDSRLRRTRSTMPRVLPGDSDADPLHPVRFRKRHEKRFHSSCARPPTHLHNGRPPRCTTFVSNYIDSIRQLISTGLRAREMCRKHLRTYVDCGNKAIGYAAHAHVCHECIDSIFPF